MHHITDNYTVFYEPPPANAGGIISYPKNLSPNPNEPPPANAGGIILVQAKLAPYLHALDVLYSVVSLPHLPQLY